MDNNALFQNMEILKEKFKISYKEAREVLEMNDNDLIESLIFLEETYPAGNCPVKSYLNALKNKLTYLYEEGSNQRIIISRKGELLADIPLTAVVLSSFVFVLYPILIPIKLGGVLLFDLDFEIIDKSGKSYNVNSDIKDKVDYVISTSKNKITDIITNTDIKSTADELKNKAVNFGKKAVKNFNEIIENKTSKIIKDKISSFDYAKFIYDAESDEVREDYNNENDLMEQNLTDEVSSVSESEQDNLNEIVEKSENLE